MKNKLMRTTALVGSMVVLGAGASVAQTTVTGSLDLSYRAVGTSTSANSDSVSSFRGFGKESQINIANKGKLNNGLDYAAGFSIEFDGNDLQGSGTQTSTMQGIHGEGVYLNLIDGNTTYHIGADWIQNPDSHGLINPVGVGYMTSFGNGVVAAGTAGISNTGGGGGAGSNPGTSTPTPTTSGANGGSGIVIIRYKYQ